MTTVFQDIFGGSSNQSTSTPTNMNPLTGQLAPQVGNLTSNAISAGVPQFNPATIAPLTPGMTSAQQQTLAELPGMVGPNSNVANYTNQVLGGAYMPGGAQGNPFISATIGAANLPIEEALKTALTQADPEAFMAAGQQVQGTGSSPFANAQALAMQSATNAESANAVQIANNAYNTGVQQQIQAANLQPQLVQSTINTLQAQLLPTLLQQQGITNGLQAFGENITALTSFLSTIAGIAAPVVGNTQQSSGSGTTGILPDATAMFSGKSGSSNPMANAFSMLGQLGQPTG